jgi:hypothetical protein
VALRNDSYTLHKILPTKVDPLVSLMKASQSVSAREAGGAQPPITYHVHNNVVLSPLYIMYMIVYVYCLSCYQALDVEVGEQGSHA